MDVGPLRSNGFNQVTPRFLEYLACGCHIISRYPDNPDTAYFNLAGMSTRVDSYQAFEETFDRARTIPCDMAGYASYLDKHYTSVRAEALASIISPL